MSFKTYTASAGSGKTYTLVKEYLTLCLKSNDKHPFKEILAVTFANKAANDMKNKVLENLSGIIEKSSKANDMKNDLLKATGLDEQQLQQKALVLYEDILHNYSDFNISTIDSFVQTVSRSFARELSLPSQYSVILDDEDLIDEVMQRIGDGIGKDNKFITEILSEFLEYQLSEESNWRVEIPIRSFIRKLLKENSYSKGLYKNIALFQEQQHRETKNYLDKNINIIEFRINEFVSRLKKINADNGLSDEYFFQGAKGLPSVIKKIETHQNTITNSYSEAIIFGDGKWYSAKGSKAVSNDRLEAIGDILKSEYFSIVNEYGTLNTQYYIFKTIRKSLYLQVLRNYIFNVINQFISETNQVHISEFNKRISEILDDCSVPFIYERVGERYKNYFVDEFQDTSILQWWNFLPLIQNSLANEDTSLVVGDAKQSIYRFRSGEVEQIIKLPEIYKYPDNQFGRECRNILGKSFVPYRLSVNYRSDEAIVNFNNSFFEKASHFLENTGYQSVYQDNMKQDVVESHKGKGFVHVEMFHAEKLKDEGSRTYSKKLYKNIVKERIVSKIDELQKNGYRLKDITILVRSNKDGSDIASYIKDSFPVVSADSILLKSSDKVQLLINTLRYFQQDDNPVTISTMNFLYAANNEWNNAKKVDLSKLEVIRLRTYNLYDLCVQLIEFYGYSLSSDIFLQYFMNMVYEWQTRQNKGLGSFLEYWNKKCDSLSVMVTGDLDAVQIMSIHKSKGLEFKVVIYPYAITKLPESGLTEKERWLQCSDFESTKEIPNLESFILPIKEELKGTDFEDYYQNEYNKSMLDDLNIMYVAMTRPKEMLFVYSIDYETKTSFNIFNYFFNDDTLFVREESEDGLSSIYEYGNFKCDKSKANDLKIKPLRNSYKIKNLVWQDSLKVDADPTMFWAEKEGFLPREWGILVHDIFSEIRTRVDAKAVMEKYEIEGTIDRQQAEILLRKFYQICDDERLRRAFSDEAVIRNEADILTADGSIIRPDRYAELAGEVVLIDYKTGKSDESHDKQIRKYVEALRYMDEQKPIKAYITYLNENEVNIVEISL